MDVGDNPSDHLPITMKISIEMTDVPIESVSSAKDPSLKWEKCSQEQKNAYKQHLNGLLQNTPSVLNPCSISHCDRSECISAIQHEYDNLIRVITESDKILPRHKPGVQKHWWTDELTKLKEQSIDIH